MAGLFAVAILSSITYAIYRFMMLVFPAFMLYLAGFSFILPYLFVVLVLIFICMIAFSRERDYED